MSALRRWRIGCALAAALGSAALCVGAIRDPRRAAFAYLTAYAFGATLLLGSLFWVLIQHLTGAYWFIALRRLAEQLFSPLPLLALLFLPVLLGLRLLYPWAEPAQIRDPQLAAAVATKLAYLRPDFFALRAVLYFAIWNTCAALLRSESARQDEASSAAQAAEGSRRQQRLSAVGLPACAFALNFAAVDWLMSLEPSWASSMFGVYVFAGSALAALALLVLASALLQALGKLRDVVLVSHYHALGKLLFTLLVFWGYVAFFQYFIIWIADVPVEVRWYLPRANGPWAPLGLLLVLGHFALPFFALLSRELKRRPRALAALAAWILAMHYLDLYWIVIPASDASASRPHWVDAAALLAVCALLLLAGVARSAHAEEAARGDPRFERALRFRTE